MKVADTVREARAAAAAEKARGPARAPKVPPVSSMGSRARITITVA